MSGGECSHIGRWDKVELDLSRTEAVLWQGRTTEAESLAREAYRFYTPSRPETLILLSDIYFEQGRFEDSLRVALGAIARLNELCVPSDALQRARAYEGAGFGQAGWLRMIILARNGAQLG